MSDVNPYGGARAAGVIIFLISIATVIVAFVHTPFGEWGTWGYLLGAVVLIFGVTFLYSALTNRMNIVGRNVSGRTNLVISVVGLVAAVVVVIGNVISQGDSGWTVTTILTTGVFIALGVMFLAGIPASRAKMRAGS
jgi:drug/metabolite transporter (DMT)-like permease